MAGVLPCCVMCEAECGCDRFACLLSSEQACFGRSNSCFLNCVFSPVALIIHSTYAYFLTCLGIYFSRAFTLFCCFPCAFRGQFSSWFIYVDKSFPPNSVSLGGIPDNTTEMHTAAKSMVSHGSIYSLGAENTHKNNNKKPAVGEGSVGVWTSVNSPGFSKLQEIQGSFFAEQCDGGAGCSRKGHNHGNTLQTSVDSELPDEAKEEIIWKRCSEVISKPVLFQNDAEPADVVQGNVGNCWLMSSLASLAEFPGLVDKVFISREFSHRGKYKVMLFNSFKDKWEVIVVDDYIPMKKTTWTDSANKAQEKIEWEFSNPVGKEIWVPILEKAFAKFRGSYKNLEGGNALWAFRVLTGDPVFRLIKREDNTGAITWDKFQLVDKDPRDTSAFKVTPSGHKLKTSILFNFLRTFDRSKALVSVSQHLPPDGTEQLDTTTGLVKGHAYSLLQVKRVGKGGGLLGSLSSDEEFELLQLRNPWGEFEWQGKWSDKDEMWNQHPKVKAALRPVDKDDGTFWMEFQDFIKHFDNIDICDRSVNFQDFHLDVHEDRDHACQHCMGPTKGCLKGCFRFWCLCEGYTTLYCGRDPRAKFKVQKGGRDDDFFDRIRNAAERMV